MDPWIYVCVAAVLNRFANLKNKLQSLDLKHQHPISTALSVEN